MFFFCRKFGRKCLLSKELCFFWNEIEMPLFKWGLSQLPKHYNPTTTVLGYMPSCFSSSKALMICTCELLQEFPCGTCNAYRFTTILFCSSGIVLLGRTHGDIHIDLSDRHPRSNHQTLRTVLKMEESSPSFSCMDTAYGYESLPTPKIAEHKAQQTRHFRYLKLVVISTMGSKREK